MLLWNSRWLSGATWPFERRSRPGDDHRRRPALRVDRRMPRRRLLVGCASSATPSM